MTDESHSKAGPIESYASAMWDSVWENVAEGHAPDAFIMALENSLLRDRTRINSDNPPDVHDLERAENAHLFQKAGYFRHIQQREHHAAQCRQLFELSMHGVQNLNLHLYKSLLLAHGAAALASLAYLGNKHSLTDDYLIPAVILLCSLGFLFSLLGSRLGISANLKVQLALIPVTSTHAPEAKIEETKNELAKIQKYRFKYEWPTWISVLLLIFAMIIGTIALWPHKISSDEILDINPVERSTVPISP